MKYREELKGVLQMVDRLPSSRNGNPRYLLMIGDRVFRTGVDSGFAYVVPNYVGKWVKVTVGLHYNATTLDEVLLLNEDVEHDATS